MSETEKKNNKKTLLSILILYVKKGLDIEIGGYMRYLRWENVSLRKVEAKEISYWMTTECISVPELKLGLVFFSDFLWNFRKMFFDSPDSLIVFDRKRHADVYKPKNKRKGKHPSVKKKDINKIQKSCIIITANS